MSQPVTLKRIASLTEAKFTGDETTVVTDVSHDSRRAGEGTLFAAVTGALFDAHKFIVYFQPFSNTYAETEYLRQLYFDTMIFTTEGVRHLVAECGASQLMIGTDYPFPWSNTIVDDILKTPGLSDADKRAILGENAAKLLKIKS